MLNTVLENPPRRGSRAKPSLRWRMAAQSRPEVRNPWQSLGQIVNHKVLPKIAAARERDRLARIALGLPLIDWSGRS